MTLETTIVEVTITRQTVFPTRAGFGIPLLMAYHTRTANMVDIYTSLKGMTDDGFAVTDSAYKMARAAFSQNPSPQKVVIGRRLHAHTQIVKILPKNLVPGFVYDFHYVDPAGVDTEIVYTNGASETAITIGTALKTAIDALAGSTATVNGGTGEVTITGGTAGLFFDLYNLPELADLHVAVTGVDASIVSDYTAIKAVDNATWYGVAIDSCAPAEELALAQQIEAEQKILVVETSDSDCADNTSTTDILATMETNAYSRSLPIFSQTRLLGYRGAAWLALGLAAGAQAPGGNSWAFLTLGGVTVDTKITEGQIANIQAKNGNVYVVVAGINETFDARTPDAEFIDLIVGTDWLSARIRERVLGAMHNAAQSGSKIPYTDQGVGIITGLVAAQLKEGIRNGFLALLPAFQVTAPKVADVDPATRAGRILPDVNFSATLAGAINKIQIQGTLSV